MGLTNNDILKKLRVALKMRDDDIVKVLSLVDFKISKSELGAFFRTEDHPKCQEGGINKEPILERNIVELFDFIADKIEVQTNVIRNNTTESIQMIE